MKEMRVLALTLAATAVSAIVVSNAYLKKQQFYPTVVYLINSNRSMGALYLLAFLLAWQLVKILKFVFFGTLRAIEMEHLIERSWFAVLDTFILLAAFHQDMSPLFVAKVTLLFVMKSFHWLTSDRVDHMEQSPVITWKFHIRAVVVLLILGIVDFFFIFRAQASIKTVGLSVEIVFGLEYAIMLTEALNVFIKYVLHTIDLRSENPWENKAIYIRIADIVLGAVELTLYFGYMAFMLMVPFIPLHIARRVYRAARDFQGNLVELVASHHAIRNLGTLYPDATPEELQTANNVCIICREEMHNNCKKLPCNHIFHTSCLRSWFQRQHTCPTCRMNVLRAAGQRGQQQQQQQQQGARQERPQPPGPNQGVPPGIPPMMFPPQMMPGWPPQFPPPGPGLHPQQQAGPPPPNAPPTGATPPPPGGAAAANRTVETDSPSPDQAGQNSTPSAGTPGQNMPGQFPFMAPPFPPGFMMPPFPPFSFPMHNSHPRWIQGLTDQQLQELEGMERGNVEARIALLRNVQQLLDTAVEQLNQYSVVMASLGVPAGPGFPGYPSPPTGPLPTGSSHEEEEEESSPQAQQPSVPQGRPLETPPAAAATTPTFSADQFTPESRGGARKRTDDDDTDEHLTDLELRQRRLQRFNSEPTPALHSIQEEQSATASNAQSKTSETQLDSSGVELDNGKQSED